MTEDQNIEDQDIELLDDEDENIEEAMHGGMKKKKMPEAMGHDPKNAEAQSVASVDKAGDATGGAPKRKMAGGTAADASNAEPMPKLTKMGMINAMYKEMKKMDKKKLAASYGGMMKITGMKHHMNSTSEEDFEGQPILDDYEVDFSADINALCESEATLSEEFKQKVETIFEAAIKSKLSEEIDRLEEKYNEELSEAVEETKADIVEKVDSYLNYVVESWMEENKVAVQAGLRTEISENFMNKLKDLFEESYIEVPEGKVDLVDDLAGQVEELEEALNESTAENIEMTEMLEEFARDEVIREASTGLAETQYEKLKSLVAEVDFEDYDTFAQKVETVKESYFTKKTTDAADIEEDAEGDAPEVATDTMAQYLSAIKKTNK